MIVNPQVEFSINKYWKPQERMYAVKAEKSWLLHRDVASNLSIWNPKIHQRQFLIHHIRPTKLPVGFLFVSETKYCIQKGQGLEYVNETTQNATEDLKAI